ncbi:hypothetical protein XH91_03380 [Bradyrhizobium guangzhouense]|uniref:Uncharacterized protein n=1 Tax=Bradyrhizobium guangzhouense TaxID=1325095 RepID=A0AAE5WWN8_9BRAD|nr:hypothetical protein XH91_03380 [Bradyrhizobium guangzhouense]
MPFCAGAQAALGPARQDRGEPRSDPDQRRSRCEAGLLTPLSFRGAAKRRARNPSRHRLRRSMDSGLALRAPRNDKSYFANDRDGGRCSAQASTLSLARG